jgi:allantoicase
MSDGWETARRRDDGNDWLVVRLAAPGVLQHAVIDTSRFVGNAPGHARLSDAGTGAELLPRTRLIPDTEHRFRIRATAAGTGAAGPTPAGTAAAGPTAASPTAASTGAASTGAAGPGDTVTGVVRLDIYPDGGISRLRLEGVVPPDGREQIARRWLDLLPGDVAAAVDSGEFFD